LKHAKKGGAIFVIGLTFDPMYPEDLTTALLQASHHVPLVYILASSEPVKYSDNDLLWKLRSKRRDFWLVNEENDQNTIDDALLEVLVRSGEKNIMREYDAWKKEGKWWLQEEIDRLGLFMGDIM
jgi:hypothetical protein